MKLHSITDSMSKVIELQIPSSLGNEKAAMDLADSLTNNLQFSKDRQAEIKTAVSEACINAIEHGNKFDTDKKVQILFRESKKFLEIEVIDYGDGFLFDKHPDQINVLKKIESNRREDLRGWGLYIIKKITDKIEAQKLNYGYSLKMFFKRSHKRGY